MRRTSDNASLLWLLFFPFSSHACLAVLAFTLFSFSVCLLLVFFFFLLSRSMGSSQTSVSFLLCVCVCMPKTPRSCRSIRYLLRKVHLSFHGATYRQRTMHARSVARVLRRTRGPTRCSNLKGKRFLFFFIFILCST